MTAEIIQFPARNAAAIWIAEAREGGWLVIGPGREHGWVHGARSAALADAQWLAENFGLPVRELVQ